ncbi:DUF61 family protein [Pyrodictium abyssi]|uniref:Uncharacterized protein n=1 Tax=Pyrodictium abyssi TaxID=54256 RepID=A0ABN6ZKI0_9CREN|nr:hypothetical protein PABY_03270 [Pyrodictium abyssi]
MAYAGERLHRYIYHKAYRDKQFFESHRPAEYKSLAQLVGEENPGIRLVSGQYHVFDKSEIELLSSVLPWYMHNLVKLPFFFMYMRVGHVGRYKLVGPDRWAARALGYILEEDITKEKWELSGSEMRQLLSSFKTLIIVSLSISL